MSEKKTTETKRSKKKTTGIIRSIDDLGRVVIPKEIRKILSIEDGDPVEISMVDGFVRIEKPTFGCIHCNTILTEKELEGKFKLCGECKEEIKSI